MSFASLFARITIRRLRWILRTLRFVVNVVFQLAQRGPNRSSPDKLDLPDSPPRGTG